jgi:DNA-binding NarL/FixJ family response regulator
VRVVIADDSGLLREALTRLLGEAGVEVCASVPDVPGLRWAVAEHAPDVAVVDIRMPPTYTHEGAAAAVELRAENADLGVLLLSQAIETRYASQLFERHGARFGYLLKDRVLDVSVLLHALHTVAAGGTVLDPEIARRMMHMHDRSHPVLALTEREREVLGLMAEGRSNTAIADRLVVSLKTVESHIANIFTKLGLREEPDDHRRVLAVLAALTAVTDG